MIFVRWHCAGDFDEKIARSAANWDGFCSSDAWESFFSETRPQGDFLRVLYLSVLGILCGENETSVTIHGGPLFLT